VVDSYGSDTVQSISLATLQSISRRLWLLGMQGYQNQVGIIPPL
jgi:hypothetical protein